MFKSKSLISTLAAATVMVGSVGLVYAQTQGTDSAGQPTTGQAGSPMPGSSTTMPSTTQSTTNPSGNMNSTTTADPTMPVQADRN
jgi:hypothetical protein